MSKKVKINGVWPLILPDSSADEWIANMEHHHNTWEMPRLKALEVLIKGKATTVNNPPIVLYIGAYKGDMPALLASLGADLVLVESTKGYWPLIRETWELNKLPEPLGCFQGLASNETTASTNELIGWPPELEPFIEGTTGFTHLAEGGGYLPEMTIDDMCEALDIIPDIITMDVEGSELEVMKGAIKTIEEHNPALMLSVHPEFMFHNHGTYERELHDLVRNRGYIGTWLDYDHEHHWLYQKGQK